MSSLDDISHRLTEYKRQPVRVNENTLGFLDNLDNGETHRIFFTEQPEDVVTGYAPYLPPLEGQSESQLAVKTELMQRNASGSSAHYASTADDSTIVVSTYRVAEASEEAVRQFEDSWVDLRTELGKRGEDIDKVQKLGLRFKT